MANWIFQGNPDRFDIDRYIAAHNPVMWMVSQHKDKVQNGDTVFLYRCKGHSDTDGGIVAKGRVVGAPVLSEDDPNARALWTDPAEATGSRHRVWILLEWCHDGSGALSRTALLADAAALPNLPAAQQTNFPLTDELAELLDRLAKGIVTRRATPSSGRADTKEP
jgi:hypothetical protein